MKAAAYILLVIGITAAGSLLDHASLAQSAPPPIPPPKAFTIDTEHGTWKKPKRKIKVFEEDRNYPNPSPLVAFNVRVDVRDQNGNPTGQLQPMVAWFAAEDIAAIQMDPGPGIFTSWTRVQFKSQASVVYVYGTPTQIAADLAAARGSRAIMLTYKE